MESWTKKDRIKRNIMVYFRIKKMVRKWIKRTKDSKHRYLVLKQWTDTQKTYLKDLQLIQQGIKLPIIKKKMMTSEEVEIVFSNIDVIYQLSQKLYQDLSTFLKSWHPYKTMIGPNVIKIHSFFKIYVEYCNKYAKAQEIMKKMDKQYYNSIRQRLPMDLESYLIKPVQRPLKYKLLLQDYLKHMPKTHADYDNIKIAVQKYRNVNQTNNEGLEKETRKQKMFALSKLYDSLLTSTRELISWCDGKSYEKNIKIYIFNDLIMVTYYITQNFQYLYKVIFLDGNSFIIQQTDGHYFDYKIFICGKNDCISIMFQNIAQFNSVNRTVFDLLAKLQQKEKDRKSLIQSYYNKSKLAPKVRITLADKKYEARNQYFTPQIKITVIGVEMRPISPIKDEFYYILKYQLLKPWKLCQYMYLDFQKIQNLYNELKKKYYNVTLPSLAPLDDFPLSESKKYGEKITELRRLTIQEFFNYCFRNSTIMIDPRKILECLNVQGDLWDFSNQPMKDRCNCKLCYNGKITLQEFIIERDRNIISYRKLNKSDYCIKKYMNNVIYLINLDKKNYDTSQKKLLYLELQQGRIDYSRLYKRQNQCIQVQIHLYTPHSEYLRIIVHQNSTVGQVMNEVCKQLKISLMNDFGLFYEYSEIPRILDPDEYIYPIYLKIQNMELEKKNSGFFSKIQKWGQEFVEGKKSKIFLRKYIFLDQKSEELSFSQNIRKYRLVINQIFYDIKNGNIYLSDDQIIEITSIYICLNQIQNLNKITESKITSTLLKQIIPVSKQSLAYSQRVKTRIITEIEKKQEKFIHDPNKLKGLFDLTYKVIKDKTQYITYYFNVKIKDPVNFENLKLSKDMIVGVNYKKLLLSKELNGQPILNVPIPKLRYFINAQALYIKVQTKELKLERFLLYSISRLIQKYKQLWNNFGDQIRGQQ